MAGIAPITFTDDWPDKLGCLRPWDLDLAHKEAVEFAGERLSALVATVSQKISAKLPAPLAPADIDDVMSIAADLSVILRGIPDAGMVVRATRSPSLGWRLVVLALQGQSYAELIRELPRKAAPLKPVPVKYASARRKKKKKPTSVAEMIAAVATREVPVRDFGSHPLDGLPVIMFAGPSNYFIRHGNVVASVAKDRNPASISWVEVNALLVQRETSMEAKTNIARQRAYGKKGNLPQRKSASRGVKSAAKKATRTGILKDD